MKESKISYSARVMIEMIVSGFIWIGAAASFMVMLKRGTLVSKIVMLSILGMKYMYSSPGERAEIKKHAVIYVIGAFILFAVPGIIRIIIEFSEVFNK